jgi:outer membrane lipoprotein carrier protein LolA
MKITWNPFLFAVGLVFAIGPHFISSALAVENNFPNKPDQLCELKLQELMSSLTRKKEKSARFKEEKFLGILEQPLKLEGLLFFRAPDYLEKLITKPNKERLIVEGDNVKILDQPDGARTLSLEDYPPLRDLLNGIRFTLLGNLDALTKQFKLDFNGDCHRWRLILIPKSVSALNIIDRVIILGKKDAIEKFTWVESNGDFTVMTIEKDPS